VEAKAPVCYIDFMKRDEVISRLQQHKTDLNRLSVEHLYMFGSTARGEAKDDSDVDLFFSSPQSSNFIAEQLVEEIKVVPIARRLANKVKLYLSPRSTNYGVPKKKESALGSRSDEVR
jgi:predicted nucleotidyltransferase